MSLESATYINQLNASNPLGSDPIASGDDHIRLIKGAIKSTFPNITGAVNVTQGDLNSIPDLATVEYVDELAASIPQTGRIVQVIRSVSSTYVESFSNSYYATGHTATITPTNSANKILILVSVGFAQTAAYAPNAANAFWTLYRGTSNMASGGTGFGDSFAMANVNTINSSSNHYGHMAFSYIDTPNTTSAITYQSYIKQGNGAGAGYNTHGNGTITLLEIAQ